MGDATASTRVARDVNLNALWSRAIVEELVRSGVRHAVICPGSRSTPLALALRESKGLEIFVGVDERSAAFFALGLGKATGIPAVVLATSGTAGAHFLPAIAEAEASGTPLIALTADRPFELHGFGAPQTMNQSGLFGRHVRFALDLPAPEAREDALVHLRAVVDRAVAKSLSASRGPVHLNAPFREPIAPVADGSALDGLSERATQGSPGAPFTRFASPSRAIPEQTLHAIVSRARGAQKGLIVCGPMAVFEDWPALVALGERIGFPVVAEAASQVRFGTLGRFVVAHHDAILRDARLAAKLKPELVLRFGGVLTTRALSAWVDAADDVLVFGEGQPMDPHHRASLVVEVSAAAACRQLLGAIPESRSPSPFAERVFEAERAAERGVESALTASGTLSEAQIAREAVRAVPEGGGLFLSSSMPIRSVEAFGGKAGPTRRVFANRGVNGIDGVVSTALGAAAALRKPTLALVGDLAFLHDLNAFSLAARHALSLTVVVVNNGGGGIFSHLPIRSLTPHFDELFATSHELRFESVAELFGAGYARPADAKQLRAELQRSLEGGLHLIEVRTQREVEAVLHRELLDSASRAVGAQS